METVKSSTDRQLIPDPYEAVLDRLLDDLENLSGDARSQRDRLAEIEAEIARKTELVERLLGELPPARQAVYRQRSEIKRRALRPAYGTNIYGNVVQLFGHSIQKEWTAPQVQEALKTNGLHADTQQVHNILSYLSRKGLLRRISRGRYYIVGAGTSVEIGEE